MIKIHQIIVSLLDNDMYKFSMGQAVFHRFQNHMTTWTWKDRNKDAYYSPEEVEAIKQQIQAYCELRFTEEELNYLSTIEWLHADYISYLRRWYPSYSDFEISTDDPCGLKLEVRGSWLDTSMYEVPALAIISEVHERMSSDYAKDLEEYKRRTIEKFYRVQNGGVYVGTFSDFGMRRRLSREAHEWMVELLSHLNDKPGCSSRFVGTSCVYLAMKYGLKPVGTQAHEWIMCAGQGNDAHNPAYCNWYAMKAWIEEYGILNGIALTDTVGSDVFRMDFQKTFARLFDGVRHDSGDPVKWGMDMVEHYKFLGFDPMTKTLLFSDSLNFDKADKLFREFSKYTNVAFGIGTYLSHDTFSRPCNIVMKVTECNGHPVAKLSDTPGKGMCKSQEYIDYLQLCLDRRLKTA